jgi:predicted molibdopterin-dependent oxidoreductase YjgC
MTEKIGATILDTLDGDTYRTISQGIAAFRSGANLGIECSPEEIMKADCVIVAGADPLNTHPVIGAAVLRAYKDNKAKIIVLDAEKNPYASRSSAWLKPKQGKLEDAIKALTGSVKKTNGTSKAAGEIGIDAGELDQAARIIRHAKNCGVVYGDSVFTMKSAGAITELLNLAAASGKTTSESLKIISLKPRGNSRGAWQTPGLVSARQTDLSKVKAAYVVIADDGVIDAKITESLKKLDFLAVQASYLSPLVESADVVIPSPRSIEREGTYTTLDGKTVSITRLVNPPAEMKQDQETIRDISKRFKAR